MQEGSWTLRTSQGNQLTRRGRRGGCFYLNGSVTSRAAAKSAWLIKRAMSWVFPPPPMGTALAEYDEILELYLRSATASEKSSGFGSLSYRSAVSQVHQYVTACDVIISEWEAALKSLTLGTDSSGDSGISIKRRNPARNERGTFAINRYVGGSLVRLPYDNQAVTVGSLIPASLTTLGQETSYLEVTCHSNMHALCDHFPWDVITREHWYRYNWVLLKGYTEKSPFAALCALYAASHARSTYGKQRMQKQLSERIGQAVMRIPMSLWGNLDFSNAVRAFCVDTGETSVHRFLDENSMMASTLAIRIINDACDVLTDMATLEPCNTFLMLFSRSMTDRADCFIQNYATWETDHELLTGSAALSLVYSITLNRGSIHEKILQRYESGNFARRPRPCADCARATAHAPFLTEWEDLPLPCSHPTSSIAYPGLFGEALDRYRANDPEALSFLRPESTFGGALTRYALDICMRRPADVSLLVSPLLSLLLIESDLLYCAGIDTIPIEYIGPLLLDDS
jgi:hypothetical protein